MRLALICGGLYRSAMPYRILLLLLSLLYTATAVSTVWCCPLLQWSAPAAAELSGAGCPHHAQPAAESDAVTVAAESGACCCPAPIPPETRLLVGGGERVAALPSLRAQSPPAMPVMPPLRPPAAYS